MTQGRPGVDACRAGRGRSQKDEKMKSFALTLAGLLAATSLASAADLPVRKSVEFAPVAPAFAWTGFYIGAQAGYMWGRDRTTEYLTATGAYTGFAWKYNLDSGFGGLHAGYNRQFGMLVAGVEIDADRLIDAKGGFRDPGGIGRASRTWNFSARGRLGVAFDRVLVYATGGYAATRAKYHYVNPALGIGEGFAKTFSGYTLGAGVEYAIANNLTARLEYRYSDYGKASYVARSAFLGLTGTQQPRDHSARLGVSYKF